MLSFRHGRGYDMIEGIEMNERFDAKVAARTIEKLLKMADSAVGEAGGSIVSQRLTDYASDELRKLTELQLTAVLLQLNGDNDKDVLRNGAGQIIGLVYSRHIFVSLVHESAHAVERSAPAKAGKTASANRSESSKLKASKPKRKSAKVGAKAKAGKPKAGKAKSTKPKAKAKAKAGKKGSGAAQKSKANKKPKANKKVKANEPKTLSGPRDSALTINLT